MVLLTSGLNREQQAMVQKCADMLHGKTVEEFSYEGEPLFILISHNVSCTQI